MEKQNRQNANDAEIAIGIDFGNKMISCAVWNAKKRNVELVNEPNDENSTQFPSEVVINSEDISNQSAANESAHKANESNKKERPGERKKVNSKVTEETQFDYGDSQHLPLLEDVMKYSDSKRVKVPPQPNCENYYQKEDENKSLDIDAKEDEDVYKDELEMDDNKESNVGLLNNALNKPERSTKTYKISNIKRLIGEKLTSKYVVDHMSTFPYEIENDENGNLVVKIENTQFPIDALVTKLIKKMVTYTEKKYDKKVTSCVISVPQFFSNSQRISIKDSAMQSGIDTVNIINEATAAAIYFRSKNQPKRQQDVLIVDYGDSKLDISLMRILKGRIFQVVKTADDFDFGSNALTEKMMEYVMTEFMRTNNSSEDGITKEKLIELKEKCEKGKECLLSRKDADILIEKFDGSNDVNMIITPTLFDNINKENYEYLEKMILSIFQSENSKDDKKSTKERKPNTNVPPVKKSEDKDEISKEKVESVILIGNIFKLQSLSNIITKNFQCDIITDYYNAIVCGDAIYAAQLANKIPKDVLPQFTTYNLLPLSLGIRTEGDLMSVIIKRGMRYPLIARKNFITTYDYQTMIKFEVYEGERKLAKHNKLLYRKKLTNLPAKLRGEVKVDVFFKIDSDGILVVSVVDNCENDKEVKEGKRIQIGNYTPYEIKSKIEEAQKKSEEDTKEEEKIKARNKLNDTIFRLSHQEEAFTEEGRAQLEMVRNWMKHSEKASKEEYETKEKELISMFEGEEEEKVEVKPKDVDKAEEVKEEEKVEIPPE